MAELHIHPHPMHDQLHAPPTDSTRLRVLGTRPYAGGGARNLQAVEVGGDQALGERLEDGLPLDRHRPGEVDEECFFGGESGEGEAWRRGTWGTKRGGTVRILLA